MAEQRSKPYPAISIEEAVKRIEDVTVEAGIKGSYDKELLAQGLGYKNAQNGAFLRTVAALVQYNLLHREGSVYKLSELSKTILNPPSNNARPDAIKDAALSPQVFSLIYNNYKGQKVPALLPNILVHEFGILPGAKDKVASLFKSSMDYIGLLDGDLLVGGENEKVESQDQGKNDVEVLKRIDVPVSLVANTSLTKDFGEGRIAQLSIPTDLNSEERKKLATLIESM